MRIVFAGTPQFAARALAALIDAAPRTGWRIALALSQPDRPSGRGMRVVASPVKTLALEHGIAVATPASLSIARGGAEAAAAHAQLREAAPDVLVVAAYGLILPQAVLDAPRGLVQSSGARLTALNIHASLLPRWRGAAPVARAIEAGDRDTGITIMQMEAGLDTGPMLLAATTPIEADDTTSTLTARLAELGARLIVQALGQAQQGRLVATPQPTQGAAISYAHKLAKSEGELDWMQPAAVLERRVRAFDPFPVASTSWRGDALRVWRAQARPDTSGAKPGTVVAADGHGIHVATKGGALVLLELQRPGGKRLTARDFLAGTPIGVGERLGHA